MLCAADLPATVLLLQQPPQLGLDAVLSVIVQLAPELHELADKLIPACLVDRFASIPLHRQIRSAAVGRLMKLHFNVDVGTPPVEEYSTLTLTDGICVSV